MAGNSEIIAILASGTSYNRWLRPYVVGGVMLGMVLWFANQYVVPKANQIRGSFEANYIDKNSSYTALVGGNSNIYLRIDSFTYAGIYAYDTANKRGGPFFAYTLKNNKLVRNIRADQISWDTASKKWKLDYIIDRKKVNIFSRCNSNNHFACSKK